MKPRLFISVHYMEIGGAETALIGLLNALDSNRVDVDLFICDHRGPMMQFVPGWVNILPPINAYTMLERPICEVISKGFFGIAFSRLCGKVKSKIEYKLSGSTLPNMSVYHYTDRIIKRFMPEINKTILYDMAINFIGPDYIITDKIKAKKTISWVHSDYTMQWMGRKHKDDMCCSTTYIASISEDVTRTYLQIYPSRVSNIVMIENILSPKFVRIRADIFKVEDEIKSTDGIVNILSIGRFCEAKNFTNVPEMAKHIQNSGIKIKWFIIGYGPEEARIRQKIIDERMEDIVIILGKKENPYPYIKACDIYVQPSIYEGKSVTVREAQMLFKPVVVTNYPTAKSQISNGIDGVIVPIDNKGCAQGIVELIKNQDLRNKLTYNLHAMDFGNEPEVEKIYKLIRLQ